MPFLGRLVWRVGITASMERKRDQDDIWTDILGCRDAYRLSRNLHSFVDSKPIRPDGAHRRRQPGKPIGRLRDLPYGGRSYCIPDVPLRPADRRFRPIHLALKGSSGMLQLST